MYFLSFLLLGLSIGSAFAAPGATTTKPATTTTSISPAGPSVSSCKGPQRYYMNAYFTSNKTYAGHVYAEAADGNVFEVVVAKSVPTANGLYFPEWSFSAAPQDHNDVYVYIPPGTQGVDQDYYYLALYGDLNNGQLQILSRQASGQQFTHYFHVTKDSKTSLLNFTFPQYRRQHTFALLNSTEYGAPIEYASYFESTKVPKDYAPVYLKAAKSC